MALASCLAAFLHHYFLKLPPPPPDSDLNTGSKYVCTSYTSPGCLTPQMLLIGWTDEGSGCTLPLNRKWWQHVHISKPAIHFTTDMCSNQQPDGLLHNTAAISAEWRLCRAPFSRRWTRLAVEKKSDTIYTDNSRGSSDFLTTAYGARTRSTLNMTGESSLWAPPSVCLSAGRHELGIERDAN